MLAMPLHASTHYDPRTNVSITGPTMKILGVDPGIHGGLAIVTLSDDAAPPLVDKFADLERQAAADRELG
jgi:hypothetical protein